MRIIRRILSTLLACAVTSFSFIYFSDSEKFNSISISAGAAESYYQQCKDMLDLINAYRSQYGEQPLKLHIGLCDVAMVRSEELKSVFSHTRPDGSDCFTVLDDINIERLAAGENIASGYTSVSSVMDAWMNSDGHRSNILSGNYEYVGIGIVDNRYWTQIFVGGLTEGGALGDVNNDGKITAVDAASVLNYYALQATYSCFERSDGFISSADFNSDGKITASDAALILQYYAESAIS